MVCLGNMCMDTLHKEDDDDDDDDDDNNNNNKLQLCKQIKLCPLVLKKRKDILSVRLIIVVLLQFLTLYIYDR